jgi:O-antigen/teichoic acid export membrane protein
MTNNSSIGSLSEKAILWSYAGTATRALSQIVIQIALARLLGPAAMGNAMLIMVALGVGWLLADSGFGAALVQRSEIDDRSIGYALAWVMVTSVVVGFAIFASAPLIAQGYRNEELIPLLRLSGLIVPLQALSNIPLSLLKRKLDMKSLQTIQVGSYIAGYGGVGITLAAHGWGAYSLIIGFGAQLTITLCWAYSLTRHTLRPTLVGDPAIRKFGLGVLGVNLSNWAIENLDRALIGRFWGAHSVGAYSAAANVARAPASLMISGIQSVVFSAASRVQADHPALRKWLLTGVNVVSMVTLPLFCYLSLNSEWLIDLMYGEKWREAAPLYSVICLSIPFYAVLSITGPMLWALGMPQVEFRIQLLAALSIVTGFVVLSKFHLTVAVWIVVAVYAFRALFVVASLSRRLNLSANLLLGTLKAGVALALLTVVSDWVTGAVLHHGWRQGLLSAAVDITLAVILLRCGNETLIGPDLRAIISQRSKHSSAWGAVSNVFGFN